MSLVREAEAIVAPGLRAIAVAPAEGAWKGQPVRLETRAYEGGPFRFARFIELTGPGLAIGNILCLPRRDVLLPIFGADLVAIGAQPPLITADLSPVGPGTRPVIELPALPSAGDLPEWAKRVFSPHPLHTRCDPALARDAFLSFPRTLLSLPVTPGDSSAAQAAYCEAHLTDDKGLGMLARMFGDAWAARFLREVMFPV